MDRKPKVGGCSPWGRIQSVERMAESSALFVSTASHRGAWVPVADRGLIPARMRAWAASWAEPGWYLASALVSPEEDCCIAAVLRYLPGFPEHYRERAAETLRRYFPEEGL